MAAARGFEPGRQHERLAEVIGGFVHGEAGTVGGQLEQHAARLLEVHRLEPEAIDHRRRPRAGGGHLRPQRELMLLVVDAPREVVHRADAPRAAVDVRRLLHVDDTGRVAKAVARPSVLGAQLLEAEHAGEERGGDARVALPDLRAEQAAHLVLRRHGARVPGRERARAGTRDQPELQPVRIDERDGVIAEARLPRLDARAVVLQARAPVVDAPGRHLERDLVRQAVAHPRTRELRPGKERQVRARTSLRVGIEQVVRAGIVLVDALLDEAHAEHPDVEVEVLLRRSGDGGDVMKAVDAWHELFRLRSARVRAVSPGGSADTSRDSAATPTTHQDP